MLEEALASSMALLLAQVSYVVSELVMQLYIFASPNLDISGKSS